MMTWIPVTEHLPDADDMVLVTCKAKNGNLSVNRAYCDEQGFWHGSGSMAGVTAWMPLPKPYREGDTTPTIDNTDAYVRGYNAGVQMSIKLFLSLGGEDDDSEVHS